MGLLDRFRDQPQPSQPAGLISVLLDPAAPFGDRDDAAMDLGAYDEPEAEQALVRVATDAAVDDGLADSCGESLAEIWSRRSTPPSREAVNALVPVARRVALATLAASRPEWGESHEGAGPAPAT